MNRQKLLWYAASAFAVLAMVCRHVTGMRFSFVLCWGICASLIAYALVDLLAERYQWARHVRRALLALFAAGFVFFLVMEGMVLGSSHGDTDGCDVGCVVILGAGVNGTEPSLSLKTRLDAALAYISDKPDIPIIASGGMGSGESISEAECMARYLTARGVDPARILMEDRSTNTRENFLYSYKMMEENGIDPAESFAFVTSNYHICRAKRIAGVPWAYGVAARLPSGAYYTALEANYYIREAFGLAAELVFGGHSE